jgi:hypothetical protein
MEMEDHLSSFFIAVDHHPETLLVNLFESGNLLRGGHHGLEIRHSLSIHVHQRLDMSFGDNDDVDRGHRVDILKSQDPIILIYLPAGDCPRGDFAEYALSHVLHLILQQTSSKRALQIVIHSCAGHFSTLRLFASLQRRNSRLRAQTVVFADATLRGQGAPKNLQCALHGSDFQIG